MAMSNSDSMVGSAIGSILVAALAAVAGDRYNYGVNLTPVNVFIDEAARQQRRRLLERGMSSGFFRYDGTRIPC